VVTVFFVLASSYVILALLLYKKNSQILLESENLKNEKNPVSEQVNGANIDAIEVESPTCHKLLWVLLPSLASVLLLSFTNFITQDIAAVPFLWVLPLSIYLLTFIICFDHSHWYHRGLFACVTVVLIVLLSKLMASDTYFNYFDKQFLFVNKGEFKYFQ
jgi:hypothetical protein